MEHSDFRHTLLNSSPCIIASIIVMFDVLLLETPSPLLGSGFMALGLACTLMLYMYDLKVQILILAKVLIQLTKILEANGIEIDIEKLKKSGKMKDDF